MSSKGRLFILGGPAGTGKTTLVRMLMEEFDDVVESISYTTRPMRKGEVPGEHYTFISPEEFEAKRKEGEILEHIRLFDHWYGTSRSWLESMIRSNKKVLLVIDAKGAQAIAARFPVTTIALLPPSLGVLQLRLIQRGADGEASVKERLEWAKHEIEATKNYDHHIVNDTLAETYQALREIVVETNLET